MRPIVFLADKLWPKIGGVESHGDHFIRHFSGHAAFPLAGVISKSEDGRDVLIRDGRTEHSPHAVRQALGSAAIVFHNSGRWIRELRAHRALAPRALVVYRTGGNEILKADLPAPAPFSHAERQAFWADAINRDVDLLITNSAFTERRLRDTGITTRFLRAVGGADAPQVAPSRKSGGHPVLFCAARFVPYKNHLLLVRTALELLERGVALELRLAGDGPLLNEVKRVTEASRHRHSFTYLGALANSEVIEEMSKADRYIQFSADHRSEVTGGSYVHSECMGRSLLEAISCGLPVVALDTGALREIVTARRGVLLRPSCPAELADGLMDVISCKPEGNAPTDEYSWEKLFGLYEAAWSRG